MKQLRKIAYDISRYIFVFNLLVFASLASTAQKPVLEFTKITTANGLSQSTVITMAQDHQGMIWIGTRDGLNRYDGQQFIIYRNEAEDSSSISNNDILDIEVDAKGNLWIGTYSGLNFFDVKSEKFEQYLEDADNPNSLSNNTIWSVDAYSPTELWIGTSNGLNQLNPETGQMQKYFANQSDSTKLFNGAIRSVKTDPKGRTWVGTEEGLHLILREANGQVTFERIDLKRDSNPLFVQTIAFTDDGRTWIGTKFHGLIVLDSEGNELERLSASDGSNKITHNNVRALEVDHENRLWVGTYNGLNRIDSDGSITMSINIPTAKNSLSENKVKSIFCSKNGSVWVGTYYGGVNMWDRANFNFGNIKQQVGGHGLSYNVVSSIVQTGENIYFATEGGGISVQNHKSKNLKSIAMASHGITSNNIKALRPAMSARSLWICTFDGGLNLFDTNAEQVKLVVNQGNGLSSNSVYDIIEYEKDFWVIATFGGGLNIYTPSSRKIQHVRSDRADSHSLSDDQIRVMHRDREGNLWIGTQKGLCYWSSANIAKRNYTFKRYFYDEGRESGEDIRVIFESSDKRIWVGSKETGLYVFENGDFRWVDVFSGYQNTSNTIHAIEEDTNGALWISSNSGIIHYEPSVRSIKLYEESDGLVSNEYNSNSSLFAEDGTMYFGGPDGVSSFFPNQLIENTHTPPVRITSLKVNNQLIAPGDDSQILDQTITTTERIELEHDQGNFTLGFALPSFVNPKKNEYVYRLKGLENNWNKSSIAQASYTLQKSGNYVFEIKGVNNDGYESKELTQLHIRVHPAPWRSLWAFMAYAVIIAVALLTLYRMIKSKAQLEYKLDLEHKTNLQQEELNKLKLQFFTNISHEFRTPLTLILGPLDQIIEDFKGSSVLYKKLKTMQQSANQLLKLINQLMDFRKIENQQDQLRAAEGNLVKFANEIFLSFKVFAKNGEFKYTFEAEADEMLVYFDRDKLERVLYNLISNAFKYTPEKGQINIKIYESQDYVTLAIKDNGYGMARNHLTKIFDRFYQVKSDGFSKSVSSGTGIGLALAKSIVDLHHGKIDVTSTEGEGSTFAVSLKKGVDHLSEGQVISDFKDSEQLENYMVSDSLTPKGTKSFSADRISKNADTQTILVVEDNDQVRNFIAGLLADHYNVMEAVDGQMGLDMALKEVPDLIISDVMMPKMDGIEFCSEAKNHLKTSHIPFILLTARTSLIFKYEGLESGADDYLNKPFNVKELELKVRNLLKFAANLKTKFKDEDPISPSEITISSMDEELLQKAIQIVDEHIDNQFLDVNLFAQELGVSRTMLFTKVKAWTDMTPNEFILSMRMKRAAKLLEQGKISISQIGYKVGFKNPKYFSKCFNKYHSLSPSAFASRFASQK
ncbi:two-component regulator propeller domain-containing protein [Reichenbachiella sp.]|uniref:hybrid sensor histidine kinase/response regulator n=1 Tax=Reichenbachiella sp. TaxID=2184521 RepID=UPI003B594CE1